MTIKNTHTKQMIEVMHKYVLQWSHIT
uniref:Uncharacterized protein n=1 Tax=Anguilla anguilla TaxID=7936 RepID=A0A0E9Q9I9_ANGAN